jgi:hypothetical protein
MIRGQKVLAANLKKTFLKTEINSAISIVSKDNKTFAINIASNQVERSDGLIPNSVILTEKPIENFKVICRVLTENVMSTSVFDGNCRIIANSRIDKLKSYAILKELKDCI